MRHVERATKTRHGGGGDMDASESALASGIDERPAWGHEVCHVIAGDEQWQHERVRGDCRMPRETGMDSVKIVVHPEQSPRRKRKPVAGMTGAGAGGDIVGNTSS